LKENLGFQALPIFLSANLSTICLLTRCAYNDLGGKKGEEKLAQGSSSGCCFLTARSSEGVLILF